MKWLNTMKFRKHPGGLRGLVTTLKILFFLAFCLAAAQMVGAAIGVVSTSRTVQMISRRVTSPNLSISGGQMKLVKESGSYTFKSRSILDRILINKTGIPDILSCIFTLLVIWQAFKIFEALKLDNPFMFEIAARIKKLGMLVIISWLFTFAKHFYIVYTIHQLTNWQYRFHSSQSGYSLGLGVIIMIIAEIYRRGCEFQEERELTV